jgi:Fe-S cluster biogenesis protein NfuA
MAAHDTRTDPAPEDVARVETSGPLFERVRAALDEIRPAIQADGGDVRLLEVEDESIAIVELLGKCVGCPMSEMTVRYGVEAGLRGAVPEILAVDVVQDQSVPVREFKDVLEQASFSPFQVL